MFHHLSDQMMCRGFCAVKESNLGLGEGKWGEGITRYRYTIINKSWDVMYCMGTTVNNTVVCV